MNVAAILSDKGTDVMTLSVGATISEAAKILSDHHIGSIVIVDEANKVAGILSERDIVKDIAKRGSRCLDEPISNSMTTNVSTCQKSDTVEYLMEQMTTNRFRHMPVMENEKMIGIVSIGDVVKRRIEEAEMEATAMRAYIATG